jgi:DNA-binding transcriptional MerR regulator/methylmalonyl-CoA mutase cobalamin-binding subunit
MDKKEKSSRHLKMVSIATVERETGLSKDTLRIWERRYGFPAPKRDDNGERVYTPDQLEKLRLIRRFMDLGHRPGKIVAAPMHELTARMNELDVAARATFAPTGALPTVLQMLKAHRVVEMRDYLAQDMMRLGLQRFLLETVTPINAEVGRAWMRGEIAIHEEHLYSEQIQHLLRQAIGSTTHAGQSPRVMLTTLPGEEHQLGLLMAQAFLSVEGAQCLSLGVQTPASDIVSAARALDADIVGLSFSQVMQPRTACDGVAELRRHLDHGVELWAGGALWQHVRKSIPGVRMLASLTDISPALADWRERRAERAA